MAACAPALRSPGPSPWLHGRAADLLFGCGGAYLLSVPLLIAIGRATHTADWPASAATLIALLVSGPHYGATLLRVYREAAERRKYRRFAVHATIALVAVYVWALRSPAVGSWLITLYVSFAVWHFAGQNYGVALMLLRRRAVTIPPDAKRWFHLSFVSSFALSFVLIHAAGSRYVLAIGADDSASYGILRLGIPSAVVAPLAIGIFAIHLTCLVAAARPVLGTAKLRDLTPALLIVVTQSVWYTIPGVLLATGDLGVNALPLTAVWISAAHAAQYLWVTSYYAERAPDPDRPVRHVGRALMAGSLATTVPALAFAPGLLGRVPWDAGLAVLTFSVLNLHHFLLDGAVWKLRDGRVARVLLGGASASAARPARAASERRRVRGGALLWVFGVPCLALALLGIREVQVAQSHEDPDRARAALERLRWLGRDSAYLRVAVGERYAVRGDTAAAIAEYERSLSVQPTANAWAALSLAYEQRGEWETARAADERALDLDPGHTVALIHGADLALRRAASLAPADASSERERADALFRRALASRDSLQDPVTRLLGLAGGLDAAGRGEDARRIRDVVSQMTPRSRSAPTSSQL
jgi:hypothetical protein